MSFADAVRTEEPLAQEHGCIYRYIHRDCLLKGSYPRMNAIKVLGQSVDVLLGKILVVAVISKWEVTDLSDNSLFGNMSFSTVICK